MKCNDLRVALEDFLRKQGYGGLWCDEPCGCGLDDLMPCGELDAPLYCEPAYALPCVPDDDGCPHCDGTREENDVCFSPHTEEERQERRKRKDGER